MTMARGRKTKLELAQEAQKHHEHLAELVEKQAGQPGITKLRLRLQDALRERMLAEQKAGLR